MSGRIPQAFIDDLLARVDIVEVIGQRIALKRSGREYSARCPFHDERSPSFTVSPGKQFFHCFGCGAHGSAIGFLMQYDGLAFVDAVETLAGQLGMSLPQGVGEREEGLDELYTICAEAASYYRLQLKSAPEARAYLARRGLDDDIAERFQLGYAPAGWDNLIRRLGSQPKRLRLLADAGLSSQGQGGRGPYDKFRERLMFPIHDRRGRVIAFGGRVLNPEQQPKYLNSPETRLFHKGEVLYGLHQARQRKGGLQRLIVVEGYMDVIALAQQGFVESVATLGTATTRSHAETLFRQAPEVVFCFDGDRAGRDAAWRALESVLPRMTEGRQAHFLFLPEGEDPDSLVRSEGADGFERRLAAATPLSDYLFDSLAANLRLDSLDGRARLADRARPLVEQIPDSAFRDLMVAELERRTGVRRVAPPAAATPAATARPATRPSAQRRVQRTPVRGLIELLLAWPQLVERIAEPVPFAELDVPGVDLLLRVIAALRQGSRHSAALIEHWPDPAEARMLLKLIDAAAVDETEAAAALDAFVERLAEQTQQQWVQQLAGSSPAALSDSDKQRLREQLARLAQSRRKGP